MYQFGDPEKSNIGICDTRHKISESKNEMFRGITADRITFEDFKEER